MGNSVDEAKKLLTQNNFKNAIKIIRDASYLTDGKSDRDLTLFTLYFLSQLPHEGALLKIYMHQSGKSLVL